MSRVTDALDAFLGTVSPRGGIVRSRNGVFTDADGLDPADASVEALLPRRTYSCSPRQHKKLKGEKRCCGCGRTRNEIGLGES